MKPTAKVRTPLRGTSLAAADAFEATFGPTATATAEHVAATAATSAKIREGMVTVRILDGIAKNVYNGTPGTVVLLCTTLASPRGQKYAAWVSAKHVEKDPTPQDEETP